MTFRQEPPLADPRPDPARPAVASPGADPVPRRPGEAVFAVVLVGLSLTLLWGAFDISGFEALSAPGSVPMATTAVMVVTAGLVLLRTLRLPRGATETVRRDILPGTVVATAGLLVAYALLLRPLGFLPTSALFLIGTIRMLGRRSWVFTLATALGSLLAIYLVFRIVFTVLMPAGIVPEGEILQWVRSLLSGGGR